MQIKVITLARILDVLENSNSKPKIIRRLYCESGQAGVKVCQYVEKPTSETLGAIVVKHQNGRQMDIKYSTMARTFEELTSLDELELLKEICQQLGRHVSIICRISNMRTQKVIQRNGLLNERKIIKTDY